MTSFNRKRLLKGGIGGVFALVVRILLQLLQVPILYSAWSVPLASAWLVLWTLPSFMAITVSAFSTAGGTMAIAAKQAGAIDRVRAAFRATLFTIIASNIAMVAVVVLAFPLIIDSSQWPVSHATVIWTTVFLGIYVVVRVQSATQEMVYRYGEDYGSYNLYEAICTLLELAITATVVNLTRNMAILPLGLALLRLASFGVISLRARRLWPEVYQAAERAEVIHMMKRMALPFIGFILPPFLFSVNLQGYSLLVSKVFGPAVFATFLTTRTLARMTDLFCNFSSRILFYELSYLDSEKMREEAIGVTAMVAFAQAGIGLLYTLALLTVGGPIHHIWTRGRIVFSPELVIVFGIAGIIRAVSDPLFSLLSARNAHVATTAIYLTFSLLALALATGLAHLGATMVEVAACVVLAELSNLLAGYWFCARMLHMPVLQLVLRFVVQGPRYMSRLPAMARRRPAAPGHDAA